MDNELKPRGGPVCADCAEKMGFTPVPWPVGAWTAVCGYCGKRKTLTDLYHDHYSPGYPKDMIREAYEKYDVEID